MLKAYGLRLIYKLSAFLAARRLGNLGVFHRVRRFCWRRVIRLLCPKDILLTEIDGQRLYIYPRPNFIEAYVVRPYECYTVELFKAAIKSGSTVLDIGAHFGYFSLVAGRQVGTHGRVYAFEPAPDNFSLLTHNIRAFGSPNIVALQRAIGDKTATLPFRLAESSFLHSFHPHPLSPANGIISVECVTLDEFLLGTPVDVIKMDIEGHELYALDGMKQTIATNQRLVLFIELNPACLREAGVKSEEFLAKLDRLGLEVHLVDESHRTLKELTPSLLQEAARNPAWYANLC